MGRVIVGVSGAKGSGKDTAADYLVVRHRFIKRGFADPLKQMVQIALGFSAQSLYGPSEMRNDRDPMTGVTARHALQTLGTEWGRDLIHPEIWTMAFARWCGQREHSNVVAPDTRFPNEIALLQSLPGGRVIRLTRDSAVNDDPHPSEALMRAIPDSAFDVVVENNGTREELYRELDRLMKEWTHG